MRIVWPRFSREELIESLRTDVASLSSELPLTRAVLFGSWATGRATAYSDVDLLLVYAGPQREDAFKAVRRHLHVRGLEPHMYTEDEAAAVRGTLDRMTRESVELFSSPGGQSSSC